MKAILPGHRLLLGLSPRDSACPVWLGHSIKAQLCRDAAFSQWPSFLMGTVPGTRSFWNRYLLKSTSKWVSPLLSNLGFASAFMKEPRARNSSPLTMKFAVWKKNGICYVWDLGEEQVKCGFIQESSWYTEAAKASAPRSVSCKDR